MYEIPVYLNADEKGKYGFSAIQPHNIFIFIDAQF